MRIIWIVLFSSFLINCSSQNNKQQHLETKILDKLNYGIVEIVVPKLEPPLVEYERPLPVEKLPYRQRNDNFLSIGTAFFINQNTLVSAAHVFPISHYSLVKKFYIRDFFGKTHEVASITKYSGYHDLIQFTLKSLPEKVIPLQTTKKVKLGDAVFSMGNALGEGISFRAGQAASFTPEVYEGKWNDIRFTSPASPGNSGGPLLNYKGQVLGVIVKKTESENLNYAVPIEELLKLSEKKALFYLRDIGIADNDVPSAILKKTWSEEIDLPMEISKLTDMAQEKLGAFHAQLVSEYHEKFGDVLYPKSEGISGYFRTQVPVSNFGYVMSSTAGKKWEMRNFRMQTVSLNPNEKVTFGGSALARLFVKVDKPKDKSLSDFMEDQNEIMTRVLKAVPIHRKFMDEEIRITNLGVVLEKTKWSDDYGRKWTSARWAYPGFDYFVYLHCMPYPGAVACMVDYNPNAFITYGYLESVKSNVKQLVVGYEGELRLWKEFLALGEDKLPTYFKDVKVMNQYSDLVVETSEFVASGAHLGLSEKSNIHFHMGHDPQGLFKEEALMFEIFPNPEISEQRFSISKMFETQDDNDEEAKLNWNNILKKRGRFSNKLYPDGNAQHKVVVVDPSGRTIAKSSVSHRMVVGCKVDLHEGKAAFEKQCNAFQKGVKIK